MMSLSHSSGVSLTMLATLISVAAPTQAQRWMDGVRIVKWDYENSRDVGLFNGREEGVAANNGTKSNPCLSVDILGDWREELVARSADDSEIRIYVASACPKTALGLEFPAR
jgi:hypothetical protein